MCMWVDILENIQDLDMAGDVLASVAWGVYVWPWCMPFRRQCTLWKIPSKESWGRTVPFRHCACTRVHCHQAGGATSPAEHSIMEVQGCCVVRKVTGHVFTLIRHPQPLAAHDPWGRPVGYSATSYWYLYTTWSRKKLTYHWIPVLLWLDKLWLQLCPAPFTATIIISE